MILKGPDRLIEAVARVVCLSEIGEHALGQFPTEELNLASTSVQPTLYNGATNTLDVNEENLAGRPPDEQCAVLCHEIFHFFHRMHNRQAFRERNQSNGSAVQWSTAEEELTITGACPAVRDNGDGWDHRLFNENAVLRDRGLPIRTSHGSSSSSSSRGPHDHEELLVQSSAPARAMPKHLADRLKGRK